MNAAMPPAFCALAMACSATVVFPELSGPYISTTRPRGRPPMPRAMSRAIEPVGITSIGARTSSPSRMTEPLPNWRSMLASAVSRALSRSDEGAMAAVPGDEDRVVFFVTCPNLEPTPDMTCGADESVDERCRVCHLWTLPEHLFDL